jgi:hypothetical protein
VVKGIGLLNQRFQIAMGSNPIFSVVYGHIYAIK